MVERAVISSGFLSCEWEITIRYTRIITIIIRDISSRHRRLSSSGAVKTRGWQQRERYWGVEGGRDGEGGGDGEGGEAGEVGRAGGDGHLTRSR